MTFLRRALLVFLVLMPVFAFGQSADQAIVSVADSPDPVIPGSTLTYTITAQNNGPNAAVNGGINLLFDGNFTPVSVVPPAGFTCTALAQTMSCTTPSFAPGPPVVFTASGTVAAHLNTFPDGTLTSVFTTSGTTPDPVPANNSSGNVVTSYDSPQVDLSLVVADNPDPVGPNGDITYTVDLTHSGPDTASSVSFTVYNNGSLRYRSITVPAGWSCPALPAVGGMPSFTCSRATWAPGTSQFIVVLRAEAEVLGIHDGSVQTYFGVSAAASDETDDGADNSETETTQYVAPDADIAVTASDSPDPVLPNGDITYTVTVQNTGPDTAPNVTLTVPMNNSLQFRSVTVPAGWACTPPAVGGGTTWSCTIASLPVQPASVFTIVLRANAEQFGIHDQTINQVFSANSGIADPDHTDNIVNVSTQYSTPDADVSITASDSPDPVTNGGTLTFTVDAANAGPDAGPNASVVLAPHPSLVFQSVVAPAGWTCTDPGVGNAGATQCTKTSMANAETAQFTIVTKLVAAGAGGVLNSIFTIGTGAQDPVTANNQVEVFTNWIGQTSDLALDKVTTSNAAAQGSTITYTIYTANNGPTTATDVTVTDTLPSQLLFQSLTAPAGWNCATPAVGTNGTITCTLASMAAPSAAQFTIVTTVAPAATGTIVNTAAISGPYVTDPVPGNSGGSSGAVTVAGNADLGIAKTTAATGATRGGALSYTITITNNGPDPAASVVMTDTLPSSLLFQSIVPPGAEWNCTTPAAGATGTVTCTAATLASGATAVFTLNTTVAANATGSITNTASVAHSGTDANGGNSSASSPATPVAAGSADLTATKTTDATTVSPGQAFAYTIAVTNNGPDPAVNPTMTDTLPSSLLFQSIVAPGGWSCTAPATGGTGTITCTAASLAATATASFTLNVTVANGASGTITNQAVAGSADSDPAPGNNTGTSAPVPVTSPAADLSIAKTTATANTSVGSTFSYTITVLNNGPATATGVTVNDTLPAGLEFVSATPSQGTCNAASPLACNLGTIVPANSATITLQVRAIAAGTVVNTATVTAAEDTATGNNTDDAPGVTISGTHGEAEIPTLSEWSLIALMAMLAAIAALRMRT